LLFGTGDPVAGGRKGDVCLYSVWRRDSFDRGNSFRRATRCFCFRFEQSDTEENGGGGRGIRTGGMLVRRVVNEWRFRISKKPCFEALRRPTLPITLSGITSAGIQKATV
jgi:hypothetical protein